MLTCKNLVAFFFSNLTLKGVEISIFNRHFFSKITSGETVENDFLNNILVAFIFSNLTLKGVELQKFGGVFFSKLTLKVRDT